MIIDLNKFHDIKNFNFDLTDDRPTLYFLIYVDEKTPRYIRKNGQYILSDNGNIIMDHGYDVLGLVPRVLKYIGESIHFLSRINEHYHKEYASSVGKTFNYFRCIRGFKRFNYDTIRIHQETLLVKKYLPEINKAAQFTDVQKLILLNSEGKVSPKELSEPYLLHARDIYKALKAWEKEDPVYIEKYLIKKVNKTGVTKPGKRNSLSYYATSGKKWKFSHFFHSVIRRCHVKQVEAYRAFRRNYHYYIKIYVPEEYEKIQSLQKITNKKHQGWITEAQRLIRQNKNQLKLI